jgi:hypothetical protein
MSRLVLYSHLVYGQRKHITFCSCSVHCASVDTVFVGPIDSNHEVVGVCPCVSRVEQGCVVPPSGEHRMIYRLRGSIIVSWTMQALGVGLRGSQGLHAVALVRYCIKANMSGPQRSDLKSCMSAGWLRSRSAWRAAVRATRAGRRCRSSPHWGHTAQTPWSTGSPLHRTPVPDR